MSKHNVSLQRPCTMKPLLDKNISPALKLGGLGDLEKWQYWAELTFTSQCSSYQDWTGQYTRKQLWSIPALQPLQFRGSLSLGRRLSLHDFTLPEIQSLGVGIGAGPKHSLKNQKGCSEPRHWAAWVDLSNSPVTRNEGVCLPPEEPIHQASHCNFIKYPSSHNS